MRITTLSLVLLLACTVGGSDEASEAMDLVAGQYFQGNGEFDAVGCPGAPAAVFIDGSVAAMLYRGAGVSHAELVGTTARIDRFFRPYRISFNALSAPTEVAEEAIIGSTIAELDAALAKADVEAGTVEGHRMAADIVHRDLREFLQVHALPSRQRINIVLLNDIARLDSVASAVVGEIAGLAFSPSLVSAVRDADPILVDALGLEGDFTPTVFLSARRLRQMPDLEAAVTVAHDVAHALGLSHDPRAWNLMYEGLQSCLPGLTADQVAELKESWAVESGRLEK
jgi:hypothetical protein